MERGWFRLPGGEAACGARVDGGGFIAGLLAFCLASPGVETEGMRPGGAGLRRVRAAWGLRLGRRCPVRGARAGAARWRGAPDGAVLPPGEARLTLGCRGRRGSAPGRQGCGLRRVGQRSPVT